jgi:hypothetical protein
MQWSILLYAAFFSFSTFADTVTEAHISIKDSRYILEINSVKTQEELGTKRHSIIIRSIQIPVTTKLAVQEKGGSIQIGGFGDMDFSTGNFSQLDNRPVQSLFSTFSGKAFNVGVFMVGRGYSSAESADGIKFTDNNLAFIVGPSGSMGFNFGATYSRFSLTLSSQAKIVTVNEDKMQMDGDSIVSQTETSKDLTIDQVLKMNMTL